MDDSLASRSLPDPLRTRPDDPSATQAPARAVALPDGKYAVCEMCGTPLRGRRPEARCCSGRCRAALSRRARGRELAARVRQAEAALRQAADAVRELKEFAVALGVPLELGMPS
jgi:hypothetical protein